MTELKTPLLSVKDLKKHFPIVKGFFNKVVGQIKAVDGVSFDLQAGECLALVGESGSGKTTVGRAVLRAVQPTSGSVWFDLDGTRVEVSRASDSTLKMLRRHMQLIFQDPYASLNPRMTVLDVVGEPLLVNGMRDRQERERHVVELLRQVGLDPGHMRRYPHAFSGGQRQRIGIARALALHPRLIVADEPVSALDVSVQAQVLNLLQDLQQELQLTFLFIAHDLGVVRHIADRVAVMYAGRLVEITAVDTQFESPAHPYTEALLSAGQDIGFCCSAKWRILQIHRPDVRFIRGAGTRKLSAVKRCRNYEKLRTAILPDAISRRRQSSKGLKCWHKGLNSWIKRIHPPRWLVSVSSRRNSSVPVPGPR